MEHQEIAYIVKRVLTEPSEDTRELLLRFEKSIRHREKDLESQVIIVKPLEPLIEQKQKLLEPIEEYDDIKEQLLTIECFEEINYYFTQTSKVSIKFEKACSIKDI